MKASTLFEVSDYLRGQAEQLAATERLLPNKGEAHTPQQNIYGASRNPWGNIPEEFKNPNNPYGARDDIGSPGWQSILRVWAGDEGKNRNTFVREKGLTPIWPDEKQAWEP